MEHFFRIEETNYAFDIFGKGHIAIIISIFLSIIYLIHIKDDHKKIKKIKDTTISVLLIQQTLLYTWYIFSGYFSVKHSLPLYNCRIAMLSLVIGEYSNNPKLKRLGVYWGIPGSIIALLYPVLDPFGIDHFTFYSFFLGHIALLLGSISLLILENHREYYNIESLQSVIGFSSAYHIFIIMFNQKVDANYCYMTSSPVNMNFITNLNNHIYNLLALFIFDIVIITFYILFRDLCDKYDLSNDFDVLKDNKTSL